MDTELLYVLRNNKEYIDVVSKLAAKSKTVFEFEIGIINFLNNQLDDYLYNNIMDANLLSFASICDRHIQLLFNRTNFAHIADNLYNIFKHEEY